MNPDFCESGSRVFELGNYFPIPAYTFLIPSFVEHSSDVVSCLGSTYPLSVVIRLIELFTILKSDWTKLQVVEKVVFFVHKNFCHSISWISKNF